MINHLLNLEQINLLDYKDEFPALQDLDNCVQNPEWHSEGSVLIHTNMVMKKILPSCQEMIDYNAGIDMYIGSMLHDFGKPEATKLSEKGQIVAYGHEQLGMQKARHFLRTYFPTFGYYRREGILSLVEYHGHVKNLVRNNSDDTRFKRFSIEVNTEQVYHLEYADFIGRGDGSDTNLIKEINIFKERCKKLDLWNKQYKIPDSVGWSPSFYNIVQWNEFFQHLDISNDIRMKKLHQQVLRKKRPTLVILVGPPGSGKSTYALNKYPSTQRICMDIERARLGDIQDMSYNQKVYEICIKDLIQSMRQGESVIWDATSVNRRSRKRLIEIGRQHGAHIKIIYFDFPLDILIDRNAKRNRKVPEHIIKNFYLQVQIPKLYEYDKLLVVDKNTIIDIIKYAE